MSVQVKICGITNANDARAAIDAGADALGFIFYERSPRFVPLSIVATITSALPPGVVKFGVFVNAPKEQVLEAISQCRLDVLQFHGDEPPEYCQQFGLMSVKAFRVSGSATLEKMKEYATDAWLLDAYTPGALGGTGATFDWDLAIAAGKAGRPIFLAGGLNAENVAEAVRRVRPFGVDVSSGVESAPGKKDHAKVAAFIRNAKTATESA